MRMLKAACIICSISSVEASLSQRKYDSSTLSYDPKGRMFQVEYAIEATRRGRTAVLGVCGDGCVALVTRDSSRVSPLNRAVPTGGVWEVDSHIGIVASGLRSDVQYVVECARTWCSDHRFVFGRPMPCQILVRRLADLIHSCTARGGKRPLAVDVLVGGVDDRAGPTLHRVQATGAFQRYKAFATGEGGAEACARLSADDWATKTTTRRANEGSKEEAFRDGRGDSPAVAVNGVATQEGHDVTSEDVKGAGGGGSSEVDCRGRYHEEGRGVDDGSREEAAVTKPRSSNRNGRQWPQREAGQGGGRLSPEHREVLKRAFLSIWDGALDEYDSDKDSTHFAAATGEGEKSTDLNHGGLRASELSATVYGTHVFSASECGWDEDNGLEWDREEVQRSQGLECSTADLEAILAELDKEQGDAREKNREGAMDGTQDDGEPKRNS